MMRKCLVVLMLFALLMAVAVISVGCGSSGSSGSTYVPAENSSDYSPSSDTGSTQDDGMTYTPEDVRNAPNPDEALRRFNQSMDEIDQQEEDINNHYQNGEDIPWEDVEPLIDDEY